MVNDKGINKYMILVNKENAIPNDIEFNIVKYNSSFPLISDEENNLEEKSLIAFLKLKDYMKSLGFIMDLESGYRTHKSQEELFNQVSLEQGLDHANMYVAKSYHSEHETGLALDVLACIDGVWYDEFDQHLNEFYKELHKCIADFGFILRYPKGKEKITGYAYEPWHLRYVDDIVFAKYVMDNNYCLEEIL